MLRPPGFALVAVVAAMALPNTALAAADACLNSTSEGGKICACVLTAEEPQGMETGELLLNLAATLILVMHSALFSGLTLGLCGLDKTSLQVSGWAAVLCSAPDAQTHAFCLLPLTPCCSPPLAR